MADDGVKQTVTVAKPAPVKVAIPTAGNPTKTASLATTFKLEDLDDANDYMRMIIYGTPGCGKTTLAVSAVDMPNARELLLIDLEEGKMAIKNNPRIKATNKITRVRVTNYKQIGEVHKFLKAHCRLRDANDIARLRTLQSKFSGVSEDKIEVPKMFDSVVIDSLTELNQFCLYGLMGYATDMDLNEAMNDDGEVDVANFAEYKKNNLIMQLLVRAFRDLPINSFFICQQTYVQDEAKKMFFAPALTGKLASQIQGFVDVVGYIKVAKLAENEVEAKRRLFLQPCGNFDAKNRQASMKVSYLDNPTMLDVFKTV